jgi:hypothetical protein
VLLLAFFRDGSDLAEGGGKDSVSGRRVDNVVVAARQGPERDSREARCSAG